MQRGSQTGYIHDDVCTDVTHFDAGKNDAVNDTNKLMFDSTLSIGDTIRIAGNPAIHTNPLLLGHMMNDSMENVFASTSESAMQEGLYRYIYQSNNNCRFVKNEKYGTVYIITTRDIKCGDELLVARGPDYWFTKAGGDADKLFELFESKEFEELVQSRS
jgi:hypothetical protein